MAKNYYLITFFSTVSVIFEKLVNGKLVDYLEMSYLEFFSDFQYGFWSSCLTVNLKTVENDRSAGACVVILELLSNAFDRVLHPPVLLTYQKLLIGFGMLIFFTNVGLIEFLVTFSAVTLHFSALLSFFNSG